MIMKNFYPSQGKPREEGSQLQVNAITSFLTILFSFLLHSSRLKEIDPILYICSCPVIMEKKRLLLVCPERDKIRQKKPK